MRLYVYTIFKNVKNSVSNHKKDIQRWCLLSPVIAYAFSVIAFTHVNSFSKIENADNQLIVSSNEVDISIDDTISNYDAFSYVFSTPKDNSSNPMMAQLFSGQGGYDSFVPSGIDFQQNANLIPSTWLRELHTKKEFPNLNYFTYRIQEGDMIGVIAERFDITQDTLISVNNIRQTRNIQIGEYLRIPSMPGILYTVRENGETPLSIAEKYEVSPEKVAAVNGFALQTSFEEGNMLFVPDALLDWVTIQEINGDLFKIPIRGRYWVSSAFGWRTSPFSGARSYHAAIDMAAPKWTRIYAALQGQVVTVRYGDPVYGNYIIVRHHSGYTSLYAHMVDINVKRWEYVDTSSIIGWVGSTGMSTGDHLHFAVLKYGTAVNPASLWN